MPFFTDQLQRIVNIPSTPKKIVSLVPSQTELLHYLSLESGVIGITKFCVHPEAWFRTKQRIGGTKTVDVEKIKKLQPDLIIANKEENVQAQIEELANDFHIWISNVTNLEEALEMITQIGIITDTSEKAKALVHEIEIGFSNYHSATASKLKTAYLIWKDPFMTVGGDTFINNMLQHAGFKNLFSDRTRYPVLTVEELQTANLELILLSSEPYPFKQKHIDELQQYLQHTKIILVDGEMFSWYGSRLAGAPAYFKQLHEQIAAIA